MLKFLSPQLFDLILDFKPRRRPGPSDQVKKLWGVDKNISFAKKTNADKWI